MAIFRRWPHNWDKNRNFRSRFGISYCWTVACRQRFDSEVYTYVIALMSRPSSAINKRRRATRQWIIFCHKQDSQWILFMTEKRDFTLIITEQNLIIRIGKSEAEVTNNKRPRSRYCIAEANYRQTRSIARPCKLNANANIVTKGVHLHKNFLIKIFQFSSLSDCLAGFGKRMG